MQDIAPALSIAEDNSPCLGGVHGQCNDCGHAPDKWCPCQGVMWACACCGFDAHYLDKQGKCKDCKGCTSTCSDVPERCDTCNGYHDGPAGGTQCFQYMEDTQYECDAHLS